VRAPTIVVMAKAPVPGRVKTRLCPPCTPAEAAAIARAALEDTLDAALASGTDRIVLALDGRAGPWLPPGIGVVRQRGDGLGERLAAAVHDVGITGGPVVVIGMDTPQVNGALLDDAVARLGTGSCDAVLGGAEDGGYWSIGLRRPDPRVFDGVPMSSPDTGRRQLEALNGLGLDVELLPVLVDVDHHAEARRVAAMLPGSRFARAVAVVDARLATV
jgi:uncharacterized protein